MAGICPPPRGADLSRRWCSPPRSGDPTSTRPRRSTSIG
jgi:hypothetical protein